MPPFRPNFEITIQRFTQSELIGLGKYQLKRIGDP